MENVDFTEIFENVKKQYKRTNILILGKTGVGKSTLLNSVFGEDLAKTGSGKPCTENIKEYFKENYPIHLIDTKGLELKNYELILNDLLTEIEKRRTNDPENHIHIAWYCINSLSNRIEEGELNIIKKISSKIPVIVVLTQTLNLEEIDFYNKIRDCTYTYAEVLRVLALPYRTPLGEIPIYGLKELVSKTIEKLPEAHKNAFAGAQQIDLSLKIKQARKIVAISAAAAATIGMTP
ncbi:MAG: GTPase domain-containing protein, partial [Parabacteroides sp.]|nr:GTPase domain-containing protein [Parabacteroides sp.]